MAKTIRRFLSLFLTFSIIACIFPEGMMLSAAEDTTLSELHYQLNGQNYDIKLVADDVNSALQENRYSVTLPYITKTYTAERLPQVTAEVAGTGAHAVITQVASFPGTAKIAVTSGTETRNYYIRFKYQPGNIGPVTNKISGQAYKAFYDLQPMSLPDLRELYNDVGSNWENYCRFYVDRTLTGISETVDSTKIPTTGEYVPSTSWFHMFHATHTVNGDSSPFFNGASWIATANTNVDKTTGHYTPIEDGISFNIDRGAWIWVGMNKTATYTNFTQYGWVLDSSPNLKMFHADGNTFSGFYKKHYNAGDTVKIPNWGTSSNLPSRMYMPFVKWDAPGSGITSLMSLTASVGAQNQQISVVPGQTVYNVGVSEGQAPVITVNTLDPNAEVDIIQAAAVPGTVSVKVISGQNTADYTINFSLEGQNDATLTGLTYTPVGGIVTPISLIDGQSTYDIVLPNTTLPNQVPSVSYVLHNEQASAVVTNPVSLPGSTTVTVTAQDGITKKAYTINWTVEGAFKEMLYAAPRTPDNGATGAGLVYQGGLGFPVVPQNYSGNVGSLAAEAVERFSTNYGGVAEDKPPYFGVRYDKLGTGGNNVSSFTKFDLSDINGNITKATLKIDAKVISATTPVGNIDTFPVLIDVYQAPETGWLTGTGTGDAKFDDLTGDMLTVGYVNNQTDIHGPLTARTAPDSVLVQSDVSVTDKTIQRVATFTIPPGAHSAYHTYDVDVTAYLAARKAAGFSTATLRYTAVPLVYGPQYYSGTNATSIVVGFKRAGDDGVRMEVYGGSGDAHAAPAANNSLEYITLDQGVGGVITKTLSFSKNLESQTFDILSSDLNNGKVNFNAVSTDAFATVSINDQEVTAGSQNAIITPQRSVATARVVVTAPNFEDRTYNLKFNIIDYQQQSPGVTVDDLNNTIEGLDLDIMEYAISADNGVTYSEYKSDPSPFLGGSKIVKIRFKATQSDPASDDTILTFAPNAGDINGDGVIDISDVIMTAEIAVGTSGYTAPQIIRANVSSKTDPIVDISDVVMIAERAVGSSAVFPVDVP